MTRPCCRGGGVGWRARCGRCPEQQEGRRLGQPGGLAGAVPGVVLRMELSERVSPALAVSPDHQVTLACETQRPRVARASLVDRWLRTALQCREHGSRPGLG